MCPIISRSWVIRKYLHCICNVQTISHEWKNLQTLIFTENYTAWYLLMDKTRLREPLLSCEIKVSTGSRGGEKTAGTRRVMADRPKDWHPRVNRWLVTFIIPTQAAQWEAWQSLSEEFSHIFMSKSTWGQGPLLSTICPVIWQRQMSECPSGKTCYTGTRQQHPR